MDVTVFWFRRDLRIHDNIGLKAALESSKPVLPIFIFDEAILNELDQDDARVNFIYETILEIDLELKKVGSSLLCMKGTVDDCFNKVLKEYEVSEVVANKDYEPYALDRDKRIETLLLSRGKQFKRLKDHLIFEAGEVLKSDLKPYTVFTPYKNKWLSKYTYYAHKDDSEINTNNFLKKIHAFPTLKEIGFSESPIKVKAYRLSIVENYDQTRDLPAMDSTSYLGVHLRFGTVSIREIVKQTFKLNQVFISELIWREFFSQILFYFPDVVNANFKKKYDAIEWRNNEEEFEAWTQGKTGYPMVDAGMRQLNKTGFMHNRARMVCAGFLCKHLLIDWRWGEAYFAKKLLDYDLASNNGNWQWAAGTGCDAAPYFRVFNPITQSKKFDPKNEYINKWIPELNTFDYPKPIVEHAFARNRALEVYKKGLINQ